MFFILRVHSDSSVDIYIWLVFETGCLKVCKEYIAVILERRDGVLVMAAGRSQIECGR